MPNYRNLSQGEQNLADSIFQNSINYKNVYLADSFLPFNQNVAVTVMREEKTPVGGVHIRYWFAIFWGKSVFQNGADSNVNWSNTLIHELTHVWQGQHGIPYAYMVDVLTN